MNFKESYNYAKNVLKGRDEAFEKELLENYKQCFSSIRNDTAFLNLYVKNIIKGRWEELEKLHIDNIKIPKKSEGLYCVPINVAFDYYKKIICCGKGSVHGRWKELEEKLISIISMGYATADLLIDYCKLVGRWEELEEKIVDNTTFSLRYAKEVIKGRWEEAEEYIKSHPHSACEYSKEIIKGRWEEAEKFIKANQYASCVYAKEIIKGRWKEAEKKIAGNSQGLEDLDQYKQLVKNKMTQLLEEKNYEEILNYVDYKHFTNVIKNLEKKNHIPDIIKNAMIANSLVDNEDSTQFMKQDKIFREKMKSFLEDYKGLLVEEVISKL